MPQNDLKAKSTYKNLILSNLPPEVVGRLQLKPVSLEVGREMEYPGSSIEHVFFIEEGVGSMTTTFKDGSQVEVGLFGYESVVGVSALMGTKRSLNRVYMQIAGRGFSSAIGLARAEYRRCEQFHDLALKYVQAQLTQATQSAACNAKHHVVERLARWLLLCADRAHCNDFQIKQEFLAEMLGSTRSTVTLAAGQLKERKLIDYKRGQICIEDPKGLQAAACECYHVVKEHLDSYLEFDTGFAV